MAHHEKTNRFEERKGPLHFSGSVRACLWARTPAHVLDEPFQLGLKKTAPRRLLTLQSVCAAQLYMAPRPRHCTPALVVGLGT